MASSIPNQTRVVDPFASYNSNVVNQITRLITHDENGLVTTNSLQVTRDSTSPQDTVIVSTGYIMKDDVLIEVTEPHEVNFTDPDQYYNPELILPQTGGYYYVVMNYTYVKSRPAPEASIKILKPSERYLITPDGSLMLLKVVQLSSSSPHAILNLLDSDPENTDNERQYLKYYAGSVVTLPTFDQDRDQSRIVYESYRNRFYFGHEEEFRELAVGGVTVEVNTDTTGVAIGTLCRIDDNSIAIPTTATGADTGADISLIALGTIAAGTGRGIITGYVKDVPIENGVMVGAGDLLYLSSIEPGKVTNVRTFPFYQVVGRALTGGNPMIPLEIIFSPKVMLCMAIEDTISGPWTQVGYEYYYDIDTSYLDATAAFDCHWFDAGTNIEIRPANVEIINYGEYIRVWMPNNTTVINYMIQAGSLGGGGGGGLIGTGTTDHNLLTNLDYASASHTGFAQGAPGGHNNTDHSEVFITAAGVTFTNLDNNGSVGTLGTQVSYGDHTHLGLIDIPVGSVILFESDIAISGYSLLTDYNDGLVYITKGSAAGGETGGDYKTDGTWSQPVHAHSIDTHTHTMSSHTHTTPAHNHQWHDYENSSTGYSWASDGVTKISYSNYGSPITITGANLVVQGTSTKTPPGDYWTELEAASESSGPSTSLTGVSGAATTGDAATTATWRPEGINYTRQERI